MSRVINPEYQNCLAAIFSSLPEPPLFQPGPVKTLSRCRAKAQSEYSDCSWPTTAHVIDTIRCTTTFNSEVMPSVCAFSRGSPAHDAKLSLASPSNGSIAWSTSQKLSIPSCFSEALYSLVLAFHERRSLTTVTSLLERSLKPSPGLYARRRC